MSAPPQAPKRAAAGEATQAPPAKKVSSASGGPSAPAAPGAAPGPPPAPLNLPELLEMDASKRSLALSKRVGDGKSYDDTALIAF